MQEIKLSLEIPTPHLEDFSHLADFDFAVAHLVLDDPMYRDFYRGQVAKGRTVLLDNGTFELGGPVNIDALFEAGKQISFEHLRPTIIAPDYPCDREETCHDAFHVLREGQRSGWSIGAVAQGRDVPDIVECYRELAKAPFSVLCFTFMSPMYHVLLNCPMVYSRWHHLFSYYDLNYLNWARTFIPFPWQLSMDTSKPIKAALAGTNLRNHKRGGGRWKHDVHLTHEEKMQAHANIVELKQACQGYVSPYAKCDDIPDLKSEYWKGSFHKEEEDGNETDESTVAGS